MKLAGSSSRSGRRLRVRLAAVVVVAPLVLGVAAPAVAADGSGPDPVDGGVVDFVEPTQLGTAAASGARAGDPDAYAFIAKINGVPVHWNKCQRIGYRVSMRRAPSRAVAQTKEAVRRVAAASGLRFDYQGHSTVRPYPNKDFQNGTELVIGWMTPREGDFPSGAAGVGGPLFYTSGPDRGRIVKGYVQLNSRLNDDLANGFGTGPQYGYQGTKGQLLMHEIGHAVGLDHVRDQRQVLYPTLTRKKAVFGAGDVNGLERVGKLRRCF